MSEKIPITVDGRHEEVECGVMLLEALEGMGVHVPTLCHHPSLEPSGACRLCVVEITHPDWKGWSGLVTSCLYPVEPGLQVFTRSEKVMAARKTLLELYLAHYPEAGEIVALARSEGVDATPYPMREGGDLCIVCGLCTRVCQDLGPAAIAPLGRGTEKSVGPRLDRVGEDCTGCGACAEVCPTGEIRMERKDGKLFIWNREFKIPLCSVKPERCRACGVCEEVCPVSVPRVAAFKTGNFVSRIAPSSCTGCGICAGACPAGAIEQEEAPDELLSGVGLDRNDLRGRTIAFACSRSPFPSEMENVIEVSCVGRVTVDQMLACLARGAEGVLLVCRDKETCPHERGGELCEKRVQVAEALAASAGLGSDRIRYIRPDSGLQGPLDALAAFRAGCRPGGFVGTYSIGESKATGLDRALEIMGWLRSQPELAPEVPPAVARIFERISGRGDTLLFLGDLPDLDLLLSLIVHEWRLKALFEDAALLLEEKGIRAKPVMTVREVNESTASRVLVFSRENLPGFARDVEVKTLDEIAGSPPLKAGKKKRPGVSPFRFRISPQERRDLVEALKAPPCSVRCESPHALAQFMMIRRLGTWQETFFAEPYMAFSDAVRVRAGEAEA